MYRDSSGKNVRNPIHFLQATKKFKTEPIKELSENEKILIDFELSWLIEEHTRGVSPVVLLEKYFKYYTKKQNRDYKIKNIIPNRLSFLTNTIVIIQFTELVGNNLKDDLNAFLNLIDKTLINFYLNTNSTIFTASFYIVDTPTDLNRRTRNLWGDFNFGFF